MGGWVPSLVHALSLHNEMCNQGRTSKYIQATSKERRIMPEWGEAGELPYQI